MSITKELKRLLTRETIRQLAGPKSFQRGEEYFRIGQVISVVEHAGKLTARVQGTEEYQITFSRDAGELGFDCTCPMGMDGVFCKHCVAVGLALNVSGSDGAAVISLEAARGWLAKREKSELVEMILDQAVSDELLRERLLLQAAKCAGRNIDITTIRKVIEGATHIGDFVEYWDVRNFARGLDQVVSFIGELLDSGHEAEAVELSEYARHKVERVAMNADDPDGYLEGVLDRLQKIHLAARRRARRTN